MPLVLTLSVTFLDAPGTSATIYYVIVADEAAIAGCPARATTSPASGVYSFVIKEAN